MQQNDEQSILRFAEAYTAAWCSQDASKVAGFYEENGSLSVNSDPPALGREAITKVAQGFMNAYPDLKVFMDSVALKDGGAIYHWTLTGTNTGPGRTGRSVRIRGLEVWRIGATDLIDESQGRFVNFETFTNDGIVEAYTVEP